MEKPEITYVVRPDTTVEVTSSDPIELVTIPIWTVTRVIGGQGWHIGKYKTEDAANWIAAELQGFVANEVI